MDQKQIELEAKKLDELIKYRNSRLELEREKLNLGPSNKAASLWKSPAFLAVFGGMLTLITAIITSSIQGCHSATERRSEHESQLAMEQKKFQSELIQKAIERAKNNQDAAINLKFLWDAGLISEYDQIPKLVEDSGSLLPSSETFGELPRQIGKWPRTPNIVPNPTDPPFNSVCQIFSTDKSGTSFQSTGVLVASNLVLTVSYVVRDDTGDVIDNVLVAPGRHGQNFPHGKIKVKRVVFLTEQQRSEYQVAALVLEKNLNSNIKYAEVGSVPKAGSRLAIAGYAVTSHLNSMSMFNTTLSSANSNEFSFIGCENSQGMSGGPVFTFESGTPKICGIYAYVTGTPEPDSVKLNEINGFATVLSKDILQQLSQAAETNE